jgi:hypothetical protein
MSGEKPRGFVMVSGLVLIGTLGVLLYVLAQSAIVTNDKAKSLALADASAKSVATWYAQILNYDAYTNRAIAANEIMIAQAVTLAAWSQYVSTLSTNIGNVASVVPALAPTASWVKETAALSQQMAAGAALIEVPIRSAYTKALQSSQQVMHASATPFAAQAMVNEVVWTADQRFFAQIMPSSNISAFSGFSKNHSGADRVGLANLVKQSQDGFSKSRSSDNRLYLLPTTGCTPTSFDKLFGKLIKRGGTWLTPDFRDWESADTLSIHTWRRRSRWNRTCGGTGESVALGWGAADADLQGAGRLETDPAGNSANPAAYQQARADVTRIPGYLGLSSYRELAPVFAQARESASIRVPVLVRLPVTKIQSTTSGFKSSLTGGPQPVGNALWSLSIAETFFFRPADTMQNPASREFANLFAPFWGSRLVPPTAADRSVALVMAQSKDQK